MRGVCHVCCGFKHCLSSIAVQPPNRATPGQRRRNLDRLGIENDGAGVGVGVSNFEYNPPDPNAEYGPATLCDNPRTVGTIWQEWRFGVGGRKPARLFKDRERGKVTDAYSPL